MNPLKETHFKFPKQTQYYKGKVRDVYTINNELLVMVASDRISAFDVVLPKGIPFKGQVLNQLAATFLEATKDIVPNWMLESPDPNRVLAYWSSIDCGRHGRDQAFRLHALRNAATGRALKRNPAPRGRKLCDW
jgi:phosphoribosylaminoimidazole-succinocarboxamide synthase